MDGVPLTADITVTMPRRRGLEIDELIHSFFVVRAVTSYLQNRFPTISMSRKLFDPAQTGS